MIEISALDRSRQCDAVDCRNVKCRDFWSCRSWQTQVCITWSCSWTREKLEHQECDGRPCGFVWLCTVPLVQVTGVCHNEKQTDPKNINCPSHWPNVRLQTRLEQPWELRHRCDSCVLEKNCLSSRWNNVHRIWYSTHRIHVRPWIDLMRSYVIDNNIQNTWS